MPEDLNCRNSKVVVDTLVVSAGLSKHRRSAAGARLRRHCTFVVHQAGNEIQHPDDLYQH